jgi:ornithine cyclodeaminase/alanine dehydrogenase-like protein (mu-crystallin family)
VGVIGTGLLAAEWIAEMMQDASFARFGMHFVGVGADGPEKHELPTELFARAT